MNFKFVFLPLVMALAVPVFPKLANAKGADQFYALWAEYQQFCSSAFAAPEGVHADPMEDFGLSREIELIRTDDRAHVDYLVISASPFPPDTRIHGIVSDKIGNQIEQSCFVNESFSGELSQIAMAQLGDSVEAAFRASDGFEFVGGRRAILMGGDTNDVDYYFILKGAFVGQDIITHVTISLYDMAIEHTKVFQIAE